MVRMMKGFKIRFYILSLLSVLGVSFLTFFGPEPSWSENALKALNFLLNFSLICIASLFLEVYYRHPEKELEIYKWFGTSIRFKDLSYYTAWSFFLIIVLHLNGSVPEVYHMIATGLAVAGLYFIMIGWYKTWTKDWWINMILINTSALSLIIAFTFKGLIEIKYPEYALAVAGLYHVYKTLK